MKTPDTTADTKPKAAPRTPAQIEASRRNGSKSQGPITPEGKRKSSRNGIRHGLASAEHTLLMAEDPAQYKEVVDSFIADLRPATKAELRLVERIANLDWRMERLIMMETCLLNMTVATQADTILAKFEALDGIGAVVAAWRESGKSTSDYLELLRRYMGSLQHQFNATLSNFHKFESRRIACKRDRDRDPEFQPPYTPPVYDEICYTTADTDTDADFDLQVPQPSKPGNPLPDLKAA